MSIKSKPMEAAEFEQLVEAFVDEELTTEQLERFNAFVAKDPRAQQQVNLARRVQEELRSWPELSLPESAAGSLDSLIRKASKEDEFASRFGQPRPERRLSGLRSALWLAAATLLLAFGLWTRFLAPSGSEDRPRAAATSGSEGDVVLGAPAVDLEAEQVQRAEAEVRYALGLVARIGSKAGDELRRELAEQTTGHVWAQLGRFGMGGASAPSDEES